MIAFTCLTNVVQKFLLKLMTFQDKLKTAF